RTGSFGACGSTDPVKKGGELTMGVRVGKDEIDAVGVLVDAGVGTGVDGTLFGARGGVVTCGEFGLGGAAPQDATIVVNAIRNRPRRINRRKGECICGVSRFITT